MKKLKNISIIFLFFIIIFNILTIKSYAQDSYKARIYIDSPAGNIIHQVKQYLEVEGWVMTDDEEATVKAYINGQEQTIINMTRKEREDVIKAIIGYGTTEQNAQPGFLFGIDTSNLKDGEYKLEVKVMSRTGKILATSERTIIVQKYKAKMYLDAPAGNNIHQVKQYLEVQGWVMTEDEEATIKAYLSGQEQTIINMTREDREDVINAITGYGSPEQNTQPGFTFGIDTNNIKDGAYKLEVKVISRTGEILTTTERNIIIEKYKAKSYIDAPTNKQIVKPEFVLEGWVMTDDENATIKVYIDGKEQIIKNIIREEREDVIKAIEGYGGIEKDPTPGFQVFLENTNINDGNYDLKIEVISREGKVISTSTRTINYENYKAKTYIDNPPGGKTTTLEHSVLINGWLMTDDENAIIKIYIDGQEVAIKNIYRKEREDVIKAISGYGGIEKNPTPGYEISVDIPENIKDGKHTLKVDIVCSNGKVIETDTRSIEINKH